MWFDLPASSASPSREREPQLACEFRLSSLPCLSTRLKVLSLQFLPSARNAEHISTAVFYTNSQRAREQSRKNQELEVGRLTSKTHVLQLTLTRMHRTSHVITDDVIGDDIEFHSKFLKPLDFDIGMEALRKQSQAEGEAAS